MSSLLPSHSTRFLLAVEKAVEDEDDMALAAVLQSCKLVLGCNIRGNRVLIKPLNAAITTILEQDVDDDHHAKRWRGGENAQHANLFGGCELKVLRRACLEVRSSQERAQWVT